MALTRITKGVIKPNENYDTHNINSTGIVTAVGADFSGNVSVGGVLTYEDVTSIDSIGIITARGGIDCNGDLDVDGHTNLDNVSIAGVTTVANDTEFIIGSNANNKLPLKIKHDTISSSDVNYIDGRFTYFRSHAIRFYDQDNTSQQVAYFWPNQIGLFANNGEKLQVTNSGVNILNGNLSVSKDIDVDGHTNLDNVSIAGVTTITSAAPELHFTDTNADSDYSIVVNTGQFRIRDETNSANRLAVNSDGHVDIYGRLDAIGGFLASSDSTIEGDLTLTSTDAGSSAAPIINLFRNSASPADADYLGQIKFQGESDTGVQRNYAKITGKILDASNGTEDGIIEFAHIKGGSQTITGRWRSDSLQLLNDTNLSVAGDTTLTGNLDVDGHTNLDNVSIAGVTTAAGSIVQTSGHTQLRSFSNPTSGAGIELGYDGTRGVIQCYDRDNSANKSIFFGGGNVGINQINPTARLDVNGGFKVAGAIDANGDLDVDGHTNLDNVSIAGITTITKGLVMTAGASNLYSINGALSYYAANNAVYLNGAGDTGLLRLNATGVYNDRTSINIYGKDVGGYNDVIQFRTVSVERLRIGSNGYVNIGTGSAEQQLTVQNSAQHSLIRVISKNDSDAGIDFGDVDDTDRAGIRYTNSTDTLSINANANTRVVIDSSGRVMIGGGSSPSSVGDGQLIVYSSDRLHPAIKVAGTINNHANGYSMISDNYTATESNINLGSSYSSASLVLSRSVKVSGTQDDVYLSSQGQYSTRPSVFKLDDDGSFVFLNTSTNATTAVDSAVTLYERLRINSSGMVVFQGGTGNVDQIKIESQGGGTGIYISNFQGVSGTGDAGRLGVGKDDNALIFMNASSSQVQNFAIGTSDSVPLVLSTANTKRLVITGAGQLQHQSATGISYFNGSSEYIFGSTTSSPPAGGYESLVQIHTSKTRSAFTLAGYNSNAGGPFMTFLSSRSTTRGTLGSACGSADVLGEIRFAGDNGTNYNSVAFGARISAKSASAPGSGDTVIAGRMMFDTGTATNGSSQTQMEIREDGHLMLRRGRVNNNGSQLYCWGGYVTGTGTFTLDVPVFSGGNIYQIDMFFSHHSLNYGCYRYGVYGAYSGHPGLQINNDFGSHSSGNGGSFTVTRGSAGQPLVVTKTAGTYTGGGYWFVNVYAGNYTQL